LSVFAIVDCNNFFVSCERVFQPDLEQRPTVVLSNNDGCVIARSNEVKALDIPMAAPFFKVESRLKSINTAVLSANFQLYGDMSWRVSEVLRQYSPHVEVYSIDEAFLELTDIPIESDIAWIGKVHKAVKQEIGLPVAVGLASTKTLAKLAVERAKKDPDFWANGGMSLLESPTRGTTPGAYSLTERMLKTSPVMDIWGIGRRLGPKLNRYGINSAWDLVQAEDDWIRRELTVRGLRTVKELRGVACVEIDKNSFEDGQKSIAVTRTFGHAIMAPSQLESAIATFGARVAAKLRRKEQLAQELSVFIQTDKHNNAYRDSGSAKLKLPYPTADTGLIIKTALQAFSGLTQPSYAYRRGGVMVYDLVPDSAQQLSLLSADGSKQLDQQKLRMRAIDEINHRYGKETMQHAVQGVKKQRWHSERKQVSPAYTTRWGQIPKVK